MAVLKNEQSEFARIHIFKKIERFIFVVFRMNSAMANYGSSKFYNAARAFDRGEIKLETIVEKLDERLSYTLNDDTTFWRNDFYNNLFKKFKACLSGCLPKRWIEDHDICATHFLRSAVRTSDIVVGGDYGHIRASYRPHPITRYRRHHGSRMMFWEATG